MKNFFLSSLMIISFSLPSFADEEYYKFSLPLDDFHLTLNGYYVEKVINAMDEDELIGFVQTGMLNTRRPAAFQASITDEMTRVLKAGLPPSPGATPLLIRINKLDIFEITTASKENAFAELSLSFFRIDGSKFIWMYDAGTLIRKFGMDVTHSHPDNILNAIRTCFEKFRRALSGKFSYEMEVTEQDLTHNPVADPSFYPVFTTRRIPRGLFRSFEDFRDCRPDTSVQFTVLYQTKNDTILHKAKLGLPDNTDVKDLWAFSDGTSVYLKVTSKDFYRLSVESGACTSKISRKDLPDLGAAYTGAGLFAGLIGVAIVAAVSSATYKQTELGQFKISFCYGDLIPASHKDLMDFDAHPDFMLSLDSDDKDTVCLFINGEYHVKLARGFFYSAGFPHQVKEIKLEARSGSGIQGEEVLPLRVFDNSLYVLRITRRNGIQFYNMAPDMKKQLLEYRQEWNTVYREQKQPDECRGR